MWRCVVAGICALALTSGLWPTGGHAQQAGDPGAPTQEPLEWKPHWRKANWWDGAIVLGGFGFYLSERTWFPRRSEPIWDSPILFDTAVRDAVRAEQQGDRQLSRDVSDGLLWGSLVHNWVFDNVVVALAVHRNPDVAWRMSVASAQAYGVTFALTSLIKNISGRKRPYALGCEEDPDYYDDCYKDGGERAFPSGHASTTATGAGLLCAHHLNLPLYDGKVLDYGACGVGIVMTLLTATLRVSSDRHWASDVLAGHAIGFSSGFLVPTLLHYTGPDSQPSSVVLLPDASPHHLGLQLMGPLSL